MTLSFPVTNAQSDADLSPGEILKQAREARGESLGEVAQALKLSIAQLSAIEESEFDALPGPTFVRGFVRNYARHLGLEAEPLLARLGAKGPGTGIVDLTPVSNARGDMPNGGAARPNSAPILLVVLALLAMIGTGLYFGWFEPQSQFEPAVTTVPAETEAASGTEETAAERGETAPETTPAAPAVDSNAAPAAPPTPAAEAPPAAANPAGGRASALRFSFAREAWLEVREGTDGSGKILFAGVVAAGSTRNIQGTPPFSLVVGNARDVKVEFNGKPVDLAPHTRVSIARLTLQ
jgi:cytoskeleton protein RodZ